MKGIENWAKKPSYFLFSDFEPKEFPPVKRQEQYLNRKWTLLYQFFFVFFFFRKWIQENNNIQLNLHLQQLPRSIRSKSEVVWTFQERFLIQPKILQEKGFQSFNEFYFNKHYLNIILTSSLFFFIFIVFLLM